MRTHTATQHSSILGTCVKAIGLALDASGCDGRALLAEAGFDLRQLDGPDARCPLIKTGDLWRIALAATGDPAFGLKVAKHYRHTTFHALGYGLSASSTLKEAFERVLRYCHVVSDAVEYQFYRRGREYHFIIEPALELPPEAVDAVVGMFLRMCRSLLGRNYSPLAIELRRPRPAVIDDFEQRWRAPLTFGAEQNRLVFDSETVERLLDSRNPELARSSDAISTQYLARIERHNIEARVRTSADAAPAESRTLAGRRCRGPERERPHAAAQARRQWHDLQGDPRRYATLARARLRERRSTQHQRDHLSARLLVRQQLHARIPPLDGAAAIGLARRQCLPLLPFVTAIIRAVPERCGYRVSASLDSDLTLTRAASTARVGRAFALERVTSHLAHSATVPPPAAPGRATDVKSIR